MPVVREGGRQSQEKRNDGCAERDNGEPADRFTVNLVSSSVVMLGCTGRRRRLYVRTFQETPLLDFLPNFRRRSRVQSRHFIDVGLAEMR